MLNLILLQAEAGAQQGSQWTFWVMMALIFVVFYFFMIRPQTKKQKELQKQRDNMKKGDKVVTAGGLYGEIKEVQENTFLVTIAKDVTIKIAKESVYVDAADAQQAAKDAPAEKKFLRYRLILKILTIYHLPKKLRYLYLR